MSLAALIRSMAAAGAPAEAIALAVDALEGAEAKLALQREAARDRKRAQRAKDRDGHGTVTGQVWDGHAAPLPLPSSPQTPQQPTPTPPDITTRARGVGGNAAGFDRFWEAYPNKTGKLAAEKAYVRAIGNIGGHDPPAVLLAGVERAKVSREWSEGYIPHPTTWLNQGRWEDEPAEIIPINGRSHERPHTDARFEARQANLTRAFAGADSAAGRDWKP